MRCLFDNRVHVVIGFPSDQQSGEGPFSRASNNHTLPYRFDLVKKSKSCSFVIKISHSKITPASMTVDDAESDNPYVVSSFIGCPLINSYCGRTTSASGEIFEETLPRPLTEIDYYIERRREFLEE